MQQKIQNDVWGPFINIYLTNANCSVWCFSWIFKYWHKIYVNVILFPEVTSFSVAVKKIVAGLYCDQNDTGRASAISFGLRVVVDYCVTESLLIALAYCFFGIQQALKFPVNESLKRRFFFNLYHTWINEAISFKTSCSFSLFNFWII